MVFFRSFFFIIFATVLMARHMQAMENSYDLQIIPELKTIEDVPDFYAAMVIGLKNSKDAQFNYIHARNWLEKIVRMKNLIDREILVAMHKLIPESCDATFEIVDSPDRLSNISIDPCDLVMRAYKCPVDCLEKMTVFFKQEASKANEVNYDHFNDNGQNLLRAIVEKNFRLTQLTHQLFLGPTPTFQQMQEFYQMIVNELQEDWARTDDYKQGYQDYAKNYKYLYNEWYFFIKNDTFATSYKKVNLINLFAEKAGLKGSVACFETCILQHPRAISGSGALLLMVKKSDFVKFQRIFCLKYSLD